MAESPACDFPNLERQLPESLWQLKPWWCQPWSIVLTGIVILGGVWLLSHRLWLTIPVGIAVGLWWGVFLVIAPRQYAAAVRTARSAIAPEPPSSVS
ncbi:MAG: hypothetical protein IGR92_09665 [Leptolyngbyaceae cyanobacterium T60_A2020_046]|nr:hypothetical protein [Leptolyngbyaceae cyanobacterium T60_A2020_046]